MEPDLRSRVRAGDPGAFGTLFDEYARAVYNVAFRMTGDWSAAEDAVSLTFLEAWRLRGRLDADGGPLRPWLFGIAVNVTRNMNRAARRHREAISRIPPPPPVPDFADDLTGQMDDAAAISGVLAAVRGLRAGEREVLALCVWSGLDYTQAAQALGVPVGTVRSRLSRARRKLRESADREPQPGREQQQDGRQNAARPTRRGTR